VIRRLWPRTRRDWAVAVLTVSTFFLLDMLALMGSELAMKLLVSLTGMLMGGVLAYGACYPFRMRFAGSGTGRLLGIFLGLVLVFGIIYAGSALAGIPAFPTAKGGSAGMFIYGFVFGFGIFVPRSLGLSPVWEAQPKGDRAELRGLAVMLGIATGLLAVSFALYVVIEYVAAPLIRYVAG